MRSAFGVDVGSAEILENRTLIPASTSTLLHPHPILCQPPFRPRSVQCVPVPGREGMQRRHSKNCATDGPVCHGIGFSVLDFQLDYVAEEDTAANLS